MFTRRYFVYSKLIWSTRFTVGTDIYIRKTPKKNVLSNSSIDQGLKGTNRTYSSCGRLTIYNLGAITEALTPRIVVSVFG